MCCCLVAPAQKSQYKFAQTHFGLQSEWLSNGEGENFAGVRFLIGGNHFWGKADFYISIPIADAATMSSEIANYSNGVITGARWIPFGLSSKAPRPFLGAQWVTPRFSTENGAFLQKNRFGMELGGSLVFNKSWTLELAGSYVFNQDTPYYTSRETQKTLRLPRYSINLSIKKFFDFTAGIGSGAGQKYVERAELFFSNNRLLSTWSIAAGLTSNIVLTPFAFTRGEKYLPENPRIALAPDLAIGYYLHQIDMGMRFSYRPFKVGQSAYGYMWEAKMQRVNFEVLKFLFDYNGFVPFLGAGFGRDFTSLRIADKHKELCNTNTSATSYALVFGWDIRPNDMQWYVLRTNIRYIFDNSHRKNGLKISTNHLEIDFIQFVIYPSRFKHRIL